MNRRIFDAHLHIIDPAFPLVPNRGFLPDPFPVEDYVRKAGELGVMAGAVVSGSFQAFDQGYLLNALERLGPTFVGVTQLARIGARRGDPPAWKEGCEGSSVQPETGWLGIARALGVVRAASS